MSLKTIITALATTAPFFVVTLAAPANAQDDRKQAQANFQLADANQDRQLDFDEFKTFINLNADHNLGRAGMIRRFGMHSRAFGTLDTDNNGAITPHELTAKAQR
ncbi:MAG: hypothetical protein AAF709_26005 [Pseudomonadota bacterium]